MKRSMSWLMLPCGVVCLAVLTQFSAAKDRDKENGKPAARHHAPPPNNPPKVGNPGGGNPPVIHHHSSNGPALGGGNPTPRKIEPPKHQPQLIPPGGNPNVHLMNNNQPNQPKRRDNDNKPGGGKPNVPNFGGNNPNFNPPKTGNNPIPNNPNVGVGQPIPKRNDNKPGGGINNPNLGNNPNFNPPKIGNPIINNPNPGGKPGGNPIINNPNLGGKPILNNPNVGNLNPNQPKIQHRNTELKPHLQQFPADTNKRQLNEQNLLRNKDHVNQLLDKKPDLRNRVQGADGKVDFSKLHLEHGNNHRIPTNIQKHGDLPVKFDNHPELSHHFDQLNKSKNLNEFNQHWKHFQDPAVLKQHPELARVDWKHASGQFQNHLADNHYRTLVHSNVGTQLNLHRQFNLYQHGDVARQMNLNVALINHGGWSHRYVGPIYGGYRTAAFSFWYGGPGFYPRYCWCPTWSPWVDWCWWNTCPVFYDPRPFVCRPIIYNPCPVWVAYPYPLWQPLPVVASGTWVDLPTPVQVEGTDLQLVAVRFVDNGHPDQNLGVRYRVWLQNNSRAGIGGPFNVLLMASNTPDSNADLPQAGVTIPSMDAGEMKSVDIRLPLAASKMNRVDDHLTPFNYLHVLVDSHRQLQDVNLANNGSVLPRADILPVDPAAFAPDVSAAAPGAMVSIAGEGFGPEPGRLIVNVNGTQTEATVYGWYDLGVQFELPNVPISDPTDAEVLVVRGDGAASNPVNVRIAPENKLEQAALPPAPEP